MENAFYTEHEGKMMPTSWQGMWEAHQSFHVKTKLATVMKEQENAQQVVKELHKGQATVDKTPVAAAARGSADTTVAPVPTLTKGANGGKAPPQTSATADGKGTGLPPAEEYTTAAPRSVCRERSPYRAAAPTPKTEDNMETNTQTKRGAVVIDGEGGQQSNPIRAALEDENEYQVD